MDSFKRLEKEVLTQASLRKLAVYQTLTVSSLHPMPEARIIVGIALQPQVSSSTEQDAHRDWLTEVLVRAKREVAMLSHLSECAG